MKDTRAKLTKTLIDGLRPQKKRYTVWDDTTRGFGVRVTPAGVKTFFLVYRMGGRESVQRRSTIGRFGDLTVDQARTLAIQMKGEVAGGNDPVAEAKARSARSTLRDLVKGFKKDHVIAVLRPRTQSGYLYSIDSYITPKFGGVIAEELTREAVAAWHKGMKDTPRTANLALAVLGSMFSWAEDSGRVPEGFNPARRIKKFPEGRTERVLSHAELKKVAAALAQAESTERLTKMAIAQIRLLLFTGMRKSEVTFLKWSYVDFDSGFINIPPEAAKTKNRRIPLNPYSASILMEQERVRLLRNPYVFPGVRTKGEPYKGLREAWVWVRTQAKVEDVRIQDLRHTWATIAATAGASSAVLQGLLGHSTLAMTQRYTHLSNDPLRAASEKTATVVAKAMGARPAQKAAGGSKVGSPKVSGLGS